MKKIIWLAVGVLLLSQFLFSQDDVYNHANSDTITSKLRTLLGYPCTIEDIINFDKVKKSLDPDHGGFEDPYNTLKHCFVFTFYRESIKVDERYPKLSVGIYRGGKIFCHLDTAIETIHSTSGRIKTIADLNKNGEVNIVITRTLGVSPPPWEEYWIFSWNGKSLKRINAIDYKMKESVLQSPWNYIKFIDIDGDGIYELVTSFKDEKGIERKHIYSWNGKLYGEWGKGSKALLKSSSKKKEK
ncbi:MAG: hypothetical protein ABR936_17325 [Bacteroidota bacterium]|jgi:hypothetical protein